MKAKLSVGLDTPEELQSFQDMLNVSQFKAAIMRAKQEFRAKRKYSDTQETTWSEAEELLIDSLDLDADYHGFI
jgi:hypothetical protein